MYGSTPKVVQQKNFVASRNYPNTMVDVTNIDSLNKMARIEIAHFNQVHHISVGQPDTIGEAFESFLM